MTTQALTAPLPRVRRRARWSPRLVRAELLKLRKRRGLVAASLVLTVLPMLIAYTVLVVQHATDPARYGPAGGMENFVGSMSVLPLLSVVAGVLVGATLGTGDLSAGVFRELVVTGRSRLAVFAARVPAGLMLLLPIVALGFAITATASVALAAAQEPPSASLLLGSAAWLALMTAVSLTLALGVSSLVASRGTSIGILLGWWLVAMPLLNGVGALGALREGLLYAAGDRVAPDALFEGDPAVPMSLGTAVAVLLAWTIAPLAVGAWRTCTRDA